LGQSYPPKQNRLGWGIRQHLNSVILSDEVVRLKRTTEESKDPYNARDV